MGMDRQWYPRNWAQISQAARERAGWRCQWCGAAQGEERVSLAGKRYQVVEHARQTRWRKHREAQLQAGQLLLFE